MIEMPVNSCAVIIICYNSRYKRKRSSLEPIYNFYEKTRIRGSIYASGWLGVKKEVG